VSVHDFNSLEYFESRGLQIRAKRDAEARPVAPGCPRESPGPRHLLKAEVITGHLGGSVRWVTCTRCGDS
jgi:hypothetical protein